MCIVWLAIRQQAGYRRDEETWTGARYPSEIARSYFGWTPLGRRHNGECDQEAAQHESNCAAVIQISVCGRTTPEADDIAIGVLDVEVLRAPRSRRKRLDDRCAVRCALRIERFDALNTGRGV